MSWWVLVGHDGPRGDSLRKQWRPGHLAHWQPLAAAGRIRFGGPLLDEAGRPRGSVVVFQAPDRAAARAQAEADPYLVNGVFERHELHESRAVLPDGE